MRTRAAWITRIQSLMRREGCRLRPGAPETFLTRVEELALPPALATVIAPLFELLGPINNQIEVLDKESGGSSRRTRWPGISLPCPAWGR